MRSLEQFQAATGFMRHLATSVDAFQNMAVWLGAQPYPKAPTRGSGNPSTHQATAGAEKKRPFGPRQSVVQGFAQEADAVIAPAAVMGGGAGSGLVSSEG